MSEFLKINSKDVIRGIATAIFAAVFISLYQIVTAPGFDLFTVDWHSVVQVSLNAAVAAFIGYIVKNLLTDSQGKFLGRIG